MTKLTPADVKNMSTELALKLSPVMVEWSNEQVGKPLSDISTAFVLSLATLAASFIDSQNVDMFSKAAVVNIMCDAFATTLADHVAAMMTAPKN